MAASVGLGLALAAGCVDLSGLARSDDEGGVGSGIEGGGGDGASNDRDGGSGTLDGSVVPGEDSGGVDGSVCPGGISCQRYVFVTADAFSPALQGLSGADAICQSRADQSKTPVLVGRRFRAWLSDNDTDATDRLVHGTGLYMLPDGALVASNFDTFVNGPLDTPIATNELVGTVGAVQAWTGTSASGRKTTGTCSGWDGNDSPLGATFGDTSSTTSAWTNNGANPNLSCSAVAHLYCLEQ
jgi:hypothetical protein